MNRAGRLALAALALLLGLGAVVAGDPDPGERARARLTVPIPEEAAVSPLELARRIRAREPGLIVLDLRGDSAFRAFHLPTARSAPPGEVRSLEVDSASAVVLYGDDPASLLAARDRLLTAGAGPVGILEGGAAGWLRDVMNPVLPDDAGPARREAFLEAAEVSRYFGGAPRIVPREDLEADGSTVSEMVESMRLRGCRGG